MPSPSSHKNYTNGRTPGGTTPLLLGPSYPPVTSNNGRVLVQPFGTAETSAVPLAHPAAVQKEAFLSKRREVPPGCCPDAASNCPPLGGTSNQSSYYHCSASDHPPSERHNKQGQCKCLAINSLPFGGNDKCGCRHRSVGDSPPLVGARHQTC